MSPAENTSPPERPPVGLRVGLLGPLLVSTDAGPITVAGQRLRTLVIRLALEGGRMVRTDSLIDAVWGDTPPAGAAGALQTLVSRLRRVLPPNTLTGDGTGYRLAAAVDIENFERDVRDARDAPEGSAAALLLGDALGWWRGPALADVAAAPFATEPAARLESARLVATEEWFEARAAAEPPDPLAAEIETFTAAHPLRERPVALLLRILAAAGRQAQAVRAYERVRALLADELGLDPSPELTAAYTAMLRGERTGNLRTSLTSFVGRDGDLARLVASIRAHRLVTLVGPGGAGKTRLATEAAYAVRGDVDGGVWIVELAPVREPDGVARALADALHLRDVRFLDLGAGVDVFDRVIGALSGKDVVLLLDNCEHLIGACAEVAEALLAAGPGVRILTTSREPLAITGELLHPVGPLVMPAAGATAAEAGETAAVRLFVDRARAVKPGFTVRPANVDAVSEICRRLDGMPLAIELASARLRTMPVEAVAARLDDRFRLLTGGSRTALPRHQTLQAVVDWSWHLLSDTERALAARFSVFLDGGTVDTVAGVCGQGELADLAGLVDKSFVQLGDDGRYRMLETIRTYAGDRLVEAGAAESARGAHAAYFTDTAEHADTLMRGPQQLRWLKWMSDERDNLSGALRWAVDSGDAATAVRLTGALGWFWLLCDYHIEAATWLGLALALPGDVPKEARALALAHHAINLLATGEAESLDEMLAEARALGGDHPIVAISQAMCGVFGDDLERTASTVADLLDHPDEWVRAIGTTVSAILKIFSGDADGAEAGLADALGRFELIGDYWARATLSSALGEVRGLRGDRAGAIAAFRSAAEIAEDLGVPEVTAGALVSLCLHEARIGDLSAARRDLGRAEVHAAGGVSLQMTIQLAAGAAEIAYRGGELVAARSRYRDVASLARTGRGVAREIVAGVLYGQALVELALGDVESARKIAMEIFHLVDTIRGRIGLSMCATIGAMVSDATGRPADTVYLAGVRDAIRGAADTGTPEIQDTIAHARAALDEEAFREAYDRGAALDLDAATEVIGQALS